MLAQRPFSGAMEARLLFLFLVLPEGKRGNGRPQAPARWGRVIGEDGGPPRSLAISLREIRTTREGTLSSSRLR